MWYKGIIQSYVLLTWAIHLHPTDCMKVQTHIHFGLRYNVQNFDGIINEYVIPNKAISYSHILLSHLLSVSYPIAVL